MNAILRDPELRLRSMTAADLEAVHAIEERAYEFPWSLGIFQDCLRVGYRCWVYLHGERIVGYGVMSLAVGEAHILNLCVDPYYQGKGLGRRLLRRLLNLGREGGADTLFLEVRLSNLGAKSLYLSEGFNEIGRRPGYYPAANGREDALVLARAL